MRYADLETFVRAGYVSLGYVDGTADFPVLSPGPATAVELQKLTPQRIVFIAFGGGAGMTTENLFDRPFITARAIGKQEDYNDAENLAWQLDTMLMKVDSNRLIGTAHCLSVVRAGGAPQLLLKDAADRYHFTCTYIVETETGL